uniref:Uncharacterized protein n=1 Tax=Rhizophora mucronata TaxID=61149 RepID=A0A2P2R2M9_RHIMU
MKIHGEKNLMLVQVTLLPILSKSGCFNDFSLQSNKIVTVSWTG